MDQDHATTKSSDDSIDLQVQRDRLVHATLPHVAFDGWTLKALEAGAIDVGMPEEQVRILFSGQDAGVLGLTHFLQMSDRLMAEDARQADIDTLPVRERIRALIMIRFKRWQQHREAVRAGLGLLMRPAHVGLSLQAAGRTIDRMWRLAGDRSHDYNYYTKRGLLASVYGSSLLCWLGDSSEDLGVTQEFVDRRLAEVMQIPALTSKLKVPLEQVSASVRAFASALKTPRSSRG